MAETRINMVALQEVITKSKDIVQEQEDILQQITAQIDALVDDWMSGAQQACQESFAKTRAQADKLFSEVHAYTDLLQNIIKLYGEAEAAFVAGLSQV